MAEDTCPHLNAIPEVSSTRRAENAKSASRSAQGVVYSGYEYGGRVEIEDDGTFKFIFYCDFAHSIEARDFIDEIKGRSQRIKIPQGNSAALKLVIQRIKH